VLKPKGISLPVSDISYDWMEDDYTMVSMDSDDEDEIKEDQHKGAEKEKKSDEAKPAGISLPTTDMSYDWMNDDDAMGTISTDEEDDTINEPPNKTDLKLDLSTSNNDVSKNDDVSPEFSPMQYWRDPIPEITDPEEPIKNAEKSKKTHERTKENTKLPKVKKEKNWLAANMAGMFDRKPKSKPKKEIINRVEKKEEEKRKTVDEEKIIPDHVEKKEVKRDTGVNKKVSSEGNIKKKFNEKSLVDKKHVPMENTWLDKWKFDDAEKKFYEKENQTKNENQSEEMKNVSVSTENTDITKSRLMAQEIIEEIREKDEVKVPEKIEAVKMKEKISVMELENEEMRRNLGSLASQIKMLETRVSSLEEKEVCDEGVDLTFRGPSSPPCPHYEDCLCLSNKIHRRRK